MLVAGAGGEGEGASGGDGGSEGFRREGGEEVRAGDGWAHGRGRVGGENNGCRVVKLRKSIEVFARPNQICDAREAESGEFVRRCLLRIAVDTAFFL